MKDKIAKLIKESIEAKERLLEPAQVETIEKIAECVINAYRSCRKLLIFGNGGSAADSQHFAAELVSRFEKNRTALPAIALTTDTSMITAYGNDYAFEGIFSRQVEALCAKGDVVIGISTSGNSANVIKGIEAAKKLKARTVVFTGANGGQLKSIADISFLAPSKTTARIQECHILAIHIICSLVEESLFEKK